MDIKHMRSLKTKTGLNKREIAQTMKACLIKIGACVESVVAKRKQERVAKEVRVWMRGKGGEKVFAMYSTSFFFFFFSFFLVDPKMEQSRTLTHLRVIAISALL